MHRFSNEIFKELMKIPENKKCFDCDKISCQWASINNGIFLCTNCSGIHRGWVLIKVISGQFFGITGQTIN